MSFEDHIETTEAIRRDANLNFLVYGAPGVGKTHLIRTLPGKVLVGSCESGLVSLMDTDTDFVEVTKIEQLRKMYKYLSSGDHEYGTLAIDSISEMAELCLSEKKRELKDGRAAYGEMAEVMLNLLRAFRDLPMTVYFSAKMRRDTVDGSLKYIPSVPGSQLSEKSPVGHKFDFVFPLLVDENDEGDVERRLLTCPTGDYQAKARDPYHRLQKFERPDLGAIRDKITTDGGDDAKDDE